MELSNGLKDQIKATMEASQKSLETAQGLLKNFIPESIRERVLKELIAQLIQLAETYKGLVQTLTEDSKVSHTEIMADIAKLDQP